MRRLMISHFKDATAPRVVQAMPAAVGVPAPAMEAARAALV
jgi:hypothetical protein